jgi:hypothetical protein
MKILYVSVNGRCYVEDINSDCKLVEEPDGIHPLSPSNVWSNAKHVTTSWGADDSLAIIWQGVTSPETRDAGITKTWMSQQLVDDFIIKAHMQKQSVSLKLWRTITSYLATGTMLAVAIGIMAVLGLLGYALILIGFSGW